MRLAARPANEEQRLLNLAKYQILDTPSEQDYDDIVRLASRICDTPISLISLIDDHRQWFKARVGIDLPEGVRDISFCAHAILQDDLFIIEDAEKDERFSGNPYVVDQPGIRFYAGMPLHTPDGYNIGTLCVLDHTPRHLTEGQLETMRVLGKQIVNHLELRLQLNELRNAYQEINRQKEELDRIGNVNSLLLSIMGHDLKSPLNTITALFDLMNNDDLSIEEFQSFTSELASRVRSTTELVDNILQWGMVQLEGKQIEKKQLNLHTEVANTLRILNPAATQKGITISNQVPGSAILTADKNILLFILRNLISNAIKFSSNSEVVISAKLDAEQVMVEVEDQGTGIRPEQLGNLFNWDKRQSTEGTASEKGSGLGLVVIHEFVKMHEGKIDVESVYGKGTKMRVSLPLH